MPEHRVYAEVFGGAGSFLFRKSPSQSEFINDINSDLIALYRVIKYHLPEFIRQFRAIPVARSEYERFLSQDMRYLTDIQRAVRFYYIVKLSFGAKIDSPIFSVGKGRPKYNPKTFKQHLVKVSHRLQNVCIENLAYQDFIQRYDSVDTFFYVDSPYSGMETRYGKGIFSPEDFPILAALLKGIDGKFMMSINDRPEIRDTFSEFNIQTVEAFYSVNHKAKRKKDSPTTELVITNY